MPSDWVTSDCHIFSHMLHVWYVHLQTWVVFRANVNKHSSTMVRIWVSIDTPWRDQVWSVDLFKTICDWATHLGGCCGRFLWLEIYQTSFRGKWATRQSQDLHFKKRQHTTTSGGPHHLDWLFQAPIDWRYPPYIRPIFRPKCKGNIPRSYGLSIARAQCSLFFWPPSQHHTSNGHNGSLIGPDLSAESELSPQPLAIRHTL